MIYAPKPSVGNDLVPQPIASAIILAFQAPPAAVIAPVMKNGKIPGNITRFHLSQPFTPKLAAASRNSSV